MFVEFLLLSLLCIYFLYRFKIKVNIDRKIPCPSPCYPLLGHVPHFIKSGNNVSDEVLQFHSKHSETFRDKGIYVMYIGTKPNVFVFKAELAEAVLKDSTVIDKPFEYSYLYPWLGDGLITSSGELWRKHRKLLNPAFHSQVLTAFNATLNFEAKNFLNVLQEMEACEWFDVRPLVSNVTLRMITATAMALPVDSVSTEYKNYLDSIKLVLETYFKRLLSPHLWYDAIFYRTTTGQKFQNAISILHKFTNAAIDSGRSRRQVDSSNEENTKHRKTFMDLILDLSQNGKFLSDKEVREEVDTIMFAGHDTTSVTLMWTLLLLGRHSQVQEKLHEELKFIFGDDVGREVTQEDLGQMKYTECVIKEALRLFPAVPTIGRKTNRNMKVKDYVLRKNTTVFVALHIMHRDPQAFESPNDFCPERFTDMMTDSMAARSFAPFALGPRNCIGQRFAVIEMKMILAYLFRKYKIIGKDEVDQVRKTINTVMAPADPINIKLILRASEGKF